MTHELLTYPGYASCTSCQVLLPVCATEKELQEAFTKHCRERDDAERMAARRARWRRARAWVLLHVHL